MYGIEVKPGKQCRCDWCHMAYGPNRKFGGFMAFADPMEQPGLQTVYGLACCKVCYQSLYRFGMKERLALVTGAVNTPRRNDFNMDLDGSKWAGEYPVYQSGGHLGEPVLCKQSPVIRQLSPVSGVHLCLVSWANTKGAPYYALDWWKQKGIGSETEPLPELPNKRGQRKPRLGKQPI